MDLQKKLSEAEAAWEKVQKQKTQAEELVKQCESELFRLQGHYRVLKELMNESKANGSGSLEGKEQVTQGT